MGALFFGSDDFSIQCLKSFQRHCPYVNVDVLTTPESKLAKYNAHNCRIYEVMKRELRHFIPKREQFEFGLVASFGQFIPSKCINDFKYMLNVHPSLLPRYRGPAPIQYSLLSMEKLAGVSIIDVHPKIIDGGDIYAQEAVDVAEDDDYRSLSARLAHIGGQLLARVVTNIEHYYSNKKTQDINQISFTQKITKSFGQISFTDETAAQILAKQRAISHQVSLFIDYKGFHVVFKHVRIEASCPLNYDSNKWNPNHHPPGTIFYERPTKSLWVKAKQEWISCNTFHMNASPICYDGGQVISALHLRNFDVIL